MECWEDGKLQRDINKDGRKTPRFKHPKLALELEFSQPNSSFWSHPEECPVMINWSGIFIWLI